LLCFDLSTLYHYDIVIAHDGDEPPKDYHTENARTNNAHRAIVYNLNLKFCVPCFSNHATFL